MSARFSLAVVLVAIALSACSSEASPSTETPTSGTRVAASGVSPSSSSTPSTTAPTTTTTSEPQARLAGRAVALDPGHNGGPVPAGMVDIGNGISHPCDSTGTANANGLSESSLVLDIAFRVRARLEAMGARVLMTRTTDAGSGPCIDERVQSANRERVDVGLSIHADGTTGPANATGFHIAVPTLIPGQQQSVVDASLRLAYALRASYGAATGLPVSNYLGTEGIMPRNDLANTNLPNHPRVLFEIGVLNNAAPGGHDDLALLNSEAGRDAVARGLVDGIANFLTTAPREAPN